MNPITRKETFLAAAGGQDVTTPTPITREEVFLNEIAKGGGGSSLPSTETASAGDVLSLDDNKEPLWAAPSGGGGGVLVVHEDENSTLDKTYAEIKSASNDSVVLLHSGDDIFYLTYIGYNVILGAYSVSFFGDNVLNQYEADAEDGYPVLVNE